MALTNEEIREMTILALDQPLFWPMDSDSCFRFTVNIQPSNTINMLYCIAFVYFDGVIDWGDGESEEVSIHPSNYYDVQYSLSHTYDERGTYQIAMEGTFQWISFDYYMLASKASDTSYQKLSSTLLSVDTPLPKFTYSPYNDGQRYMILNGMFNRCINLKTVHPKLLQKNKGGYCTSYRDISNFYNFFPRYMFFECRSLEEIPDGLFNGIIFDSRGALPGTFEGSFEDMFYGCSSITDIPPDLFNNDTLSCITNINGMFYNCSGIKSVPNIFNKFVNVKGIESTFANCTALEEISADLFKHCTHVISFIDCFFYCHNLKRIPAGLFSNCREVISFAQCFNACNSIKSIPSDLFADCTEVDSFSYCFSTCWNLESIPSGLFDSCTKVTNFRSCFASCLAIEIIPNGLFDSCTDVTDFSYCFENCSYIESIPEGLFNVSRSVTTFESCFRGCRKINSVPEDLFYGNRLARNFMNTFNGCGRIQSNIPELWITHANADHDLCYRGCVLAQNYSDIPSDWK